jgi:hypothetical protein
MLVKIENLISRLLEGRKDQYLTEVPEKVAGGMEEYIDEDEKPLFKLRSFRALYSTPTWIESNQFFSAWVIVTSKRLMILKNSSSFKLFRDIPLGSIEELNYEFEPRKYKITIKSPHKTDILEFTGESINFCPELRRILETVCTPSRLTGKVRTPSLGISHCYFCGFRLPNPANFCPECGKKLVG